MKSKITIILITSLIVVIGLRICFSFAIVNGVSMENTFQENQILLVRNLFYNVDRFDCVLIRHGNQIFVKRVIGLPNDKVQFIDDKLYINGEIVEEDFIKGHTEDLEVEVTSDGYYCLGDNREHSCDSRNYGEFNKSDIIGEVIGR